MVLRRIAWSSPPSSVGMFIIICCLSPTQLLPSVWKGIFVILIFIFPCSVVNFSESANKNSIILPKTVTSPPKENEDICTFLAAGWAVGVEGCWYSNSFQTKCQTRTQGVQHRWQIQPNWTIFRNVQHFELRLLRITLQMLPVLCHNSSLRTYRLDWEEATRTKP